METGRRERKVFLLFRDRSNRRKSSQESSLPLQHEREGQCNEHTCSDSLLTPGVADSQRIM